jgi:hypothetical protein
MITSASVPPSNVAVPVDGNPMLMAAAKQNTPIATSKIHSSETILSTSPSDRTAGAGAFACAILVCFTFGARGQVFFFFSLKKVEKTHLRICEKRQKAPLASAPYGGGSQP